MKHYGNSSAQPGLAFGQFGMAVFIFLIALPIFGLTILFPPWLEVHCQRRQILFWSERVKTYDTSFAGFDFMLDRQKSGSMKTPPNPSSDTLFDSSEFDVFWPLLIAEWVTIIVVCGVCYIRLFHRVFQLPQRPELAEPSHALDRANGPVSNQESNPHAQ